MSGFVEQPFKQPRLQSSQEHFAKIPDIGIPRSVFNRTSQYKTTFNSGLLIPVFLDEMLPGDSFKVTATTFARLATPIAPFMDNLYCDLHFWFVPERLLWSNWEKFQGAQANPGDSIDFLMPQVMSPTSGTLPWPAGSIYDYAGLPTGVTPTSGSMRVRASHFRAYNLIWNTWYRDQNLQNSVTVNLGDGPDASTDYTLLRRGKRHDYFTSALPSPQKGAAVELPLGTTVPVYGPTQLTTSTGSRNMAVYNSTTGDWVENAFIQNTTGTSLALDHTPGVSGGYLGIPPAGHDSGANQPYADLTQATAATINVIREAITLQQYLERDARGGTRYVEILKSRFGVTAPDFRLFRPEFIGGGSAMINTAPVPQTSSSDATTPQGNLAAMGSFSHKGIGFNYSAVEHGVVLGLVSVRADLTYQQGLNKMWTRRTRYDFYDPIFANLGEQAVMRSEIYFEPDSVPADVVFGYQERWAEYRYKPSMITGQFRSNFAQSLDFWHLAQEFSTAPTLNSTFISENPPVDRVIAVEEGSGYPQFLFDAVFDQRAARPMPTYSVPGLLRL